MCIRDSPAIDFTLKDQFGNTHTLSDYKGKTVFLNFWATWCPPCRREMPDIQNIYETYDTEGDDGLIVLGIAAPNMGSEGSEEEITQFLEENGYTYPVVMDTTGEIFSAYGITSFPTTFMIDRDGNVDVYKRQRVRGICTVVWSKHCLQAIRRRLVSLLSNRGKSV